MGHFCNSPCFIYFYSFLIIMISYDSHTFQPLKHEIFSLFVHSRFITEMKSQDLRKTVMRMIDDGLSSRQIAQQLRNVVTKSTVQR